MDDAYVDFPTKIFLDSNVILECLPLINLPWYEIDPIGPILILVTPTVLREVDSKKGDGRVGLRAREFSRLIAPIAEHGMPINIVTESANIHIAIARCRRIDWDSYDDLNQSEGDEKIIAEVLNVKGVPMEQRRVVSKDSYPLILAQRHGLKTHRVPDAWLPPLGLSPQENEIAKLKKQIKVYEKTEPEFKIKHEVQAAPVEVHQVQELTEVEISQLTREIITSNPKPEQKQDLLSFMQHDSSLDERYEKYARQTVPVFVRDYHKKLELLFDQIPFTLFVENTGKVRAEHANIDIHIVGGWFNQKPILAGLRPSSPKIKNPLHRPIILPHIPTKRVAGRHEIEVNLARCSEHLLAQCEDFRQGQKWEFNGVVWLDPHRHGEVVIIVKITAANLHGEFQTQFKLNKILIPCQVSDLIDMGSGKIVKEYYVKSLIENAFRAENHNAFEWDRVTNDD